MGSTEQKIRLLATDLDGTLLDSRKRLSDRNLAALESASARGVIIVPATGRLYSGMPETVRTLPFVRYVITVNGAAVIDTLEDLVLYSSEISPADYERFLWHAPKLPALWDCYQHGDALIDERQYQKIDDYIYDPFVADMVRNSRIPVPDLPGRLLSSRMPVQKLQLFFRDTTTRDDSLSHLRTLFPQLELSHSYSYNLELTSKGADKGTALVSLCRHIGMGLSATVAFGDEVNDISMLRTAGIGVAMGNATVEVRRAADIIAPTNDEDGLACIVERLLLAK